MKFSHLEKWLYLRIHWSKKIHLFSIIYNCYEFPYYCKQSNIKRIPINSLMVLSFFSTSMILMHCFNFCASCSLFTISQTRDTILLTNGFVLECFYWTENIATKCIKIICKKKTWFARNVMYFLVVIVNIYVLCVYILLHQLFLK